MTPANTPLGFTYNRTEPAVNALFRTVEGADVAYYSIGILWRVCKIAAGDEIDANLFVHLRPEDFDNSWAPTETLMEAAAITRTADPSKVFGDLRLLGEVITELYPLQTKVSSHLSQKTAELSIVASPHGTSSPTPTISTAEE